MGWALERCIRKCDDEELADLQRALRLLSTNQAVLEDPRTLALVMMRRAQVAAEIAMRGEQLRLDL